MAEPSAEVVRAARFTKGAGESSRSGTDEILAAAAQVFMRRGYAATSIDDIAAILGATKGRIYHHFHSKSELFVNVHLQALLRMIEMARPIVEGSGPPADRLRALVHAQAVAIMTDFAPSKVALQGLERHGLGTTPASHRRAVREIVDLRDRYEQMFVALIDQGIRTGVFATDSMPVAVRAALGAINWLTVWFNPDRPTGTEARAAIADTIADFVVRGLSVPAPAKRGR